MKSTKHAVEYRRKHKEEKRNRDYIRNYGITTEVYNQMFVNQNGKCAICGRSPVGAERFHVDHDHNTGKIRGLLCLQCNHGIGRFKDNVSLLLKAIEYLSKN
jgi:hypothetical protein